MYGCSKTSSSPSGNNGNGGASAAIQNYAFAPDTVRITTGQTVKWTNMDAAAHTVTATNATWDSGNVTPQCRLPVQISGLMVHLPAAVPFT